MVAGVLNLLLEQGADFDYTITWSDSSGNPINLTGYYVQLRIQPPNSQLISFDTDGSYVSLTPTSGIINISVPGESITTNYTWLSAPYCIQLTSGSGVVTRLLQGVINNNLRPA